MFPNNHGESCYTNNNDQYQQQQQKPRPCARVINQHHQESNSVTYTDNEFLNLEDFLVDESKSQRNANDDGYSSFSSGQQVLGSFIHRDGDGNELIPSGQHWTDNNNDPLQHLQSFIGSFIIPSFSSSTTAQANITSNNESNNVNNLSNSSDENSSEFFPIACEQCRQQHRRCDKRLPKCYLCTQRKVECVYREPRRNKKTNHDNNVKTPENSRNHSSNVHQRNVNNPSTHSMNPLFSPYPLGKKSVNEELKTSESLSSRAVFDLYFDVACEGYPLVSREELENFITHFPNCDDVGNDTNKLQNCEMFAMYFSVRALCESRNGLFEQSEKSIQKSKDCLSKVFDRTSITVAAVYAHLVMYELYTGKTEQAKFYFTILDFLSKKLFAPEDSESVTPSQPTIYEKNLEVWIYSYNAALKLGIIEDFDKVSVENFLSCIPEIYSFFCQEPLPQEWIQLMTSKVTPENCFEIWSIIELLVNKFKNIEKSDMLSIPDTVNRLEFVEPLYQMILDSLRIAILSKSQSSITREVIEQSALSITNHTENPLYPLFPIDVVFCVKQAVEKHLEICNSILQQGGNDFVHNGVDYCSILKKDLRAFTVMKPKFKAVNKWINNISSRIEEMIATIERVKFQ
ncbi:hypothetical protein C9374_006516 [Naegleria lovaniensis]|uniref:Zn(2)-C6 fungal-type domain-containing protein n=1 Tax=Naegleria lovaniensis TaxID=51637 RepID=A0AA88KHV1_NAELO|nr:uncharacterized protein C9374_006516 [Naegleria lovaniensis]KAG2381527.1 hypothetical protein C9374_006516 [Naegleria lovaniensis]